VFARSDVAVPLGVWTHIATVYNDNEVSIYRNGVKIVSKVCNGQCSGSLPFSSSAAATKVISGETNVILGGAGSAFDGMISEMRLWSTDRSTQIKSYWDKRLLTKNWPQGSPLFSQLVGYWHMNEGFGNIVLDYSTPKRANSNGLMSPTWTYEDPRDLHKAEVLRRWIVEAWNGSWTQNVPRNCIDEDKMQHLNQLKAFPRLGPVSGSTRVRFLFSGLYDDHGMFGPEVRNSDVSEASDPMSETPAFREQDELRWESNRRHLRESYKCQQLLAPTDVRHGHVGGIGSRMMEVVAQTISPTIPDYSAVAIGDLDGTGAIGAVAGHASVGSLEVYTSRGEPADPMYDMPRFKAFREFNGKASSILVSDFDNNGHMDVLVLGEPTTMFMQVPSCRECGPYYNPDGNLFVRVVSKADAKPKPLDKALPAAECVPGPITSISYEKASNGSYAFVYKPVGQCISPPVVSGAGVQAYVKDINGDSRPDVIAGKTGSNMQIFVAPTGNETSFVAQSVTLPPAGNVGQVVIADLVSPSEERIRTDVLVIETNSAPKIYSGTYNTRPNLSSQLTLMDPAERAKTLSAMTVHDRVAQLMHLLPDDRAITMSLLPSEQKLEALAAKAPADIPVLDPGTITLKYSFDAGSDPRLGSLISAEVADFNNDGFNDIIFVGATGNHAVYLNNGGGSTVSSTVPGFTSTGQIITKNPGAVGASLGDVDKDGDIDLYTVSSSGALDHIWINDGNGAFTFDTNVADYLLLSALGSDQKLMKWRLNSDAFPLENAENRARMNKLSEAWKQYTIPDTSKPIQRSAMVPKSVVGNFAREGVYSIATIAAGTESTLGPGTRVRLCQSQLSPLAVQMRYGVGEITGDGGLGRIVSFSRDNKMRDQRVGQNLTLEYKWQKNRSLKYRDDKTDFRDIEPGMPEGKFKSLTEMVHSKTGTWWFTEAADLVTKPASQSGVARVLPYIGGYEQEGDVSMINMAFSFYNEPIFESIMPRRVGNFAKAGSSPEVLTISGSGFFNPFVPTQSKLSQASPLVNQHGYRHTVMGETGVYITARFNISGITSYHVVTFVSATTLTVEKPWRQLTNSNITGTLEVSFNGQNYHRVPGIVEFRIPVHVRISPKEIDKTLSHVVTIHGKDYYDTGKIMVHLTPQIKTIHQVGQAVKIPGKYISASQISFEMPAGNIGDVTLEWKLQVTFNSSSVIENSWNTNYTGSGLRKGFYEKVPVPLVSYDQSIIPNNTAKLIPAKDVGGEYHFGPFHTVNYSESDFNKAPLPYQRAPFAPGKVQIGTFRGRMDLGRTEVCSYKDRAGTEYHSSPIHQLPRAIMLIPSKNKLTLNHEWSGTDPWLYTNAPNYTDGQWVRAEYIANKKNTGIVKSSTDAVATQFMVHGCFKVPRAPLVSEGPQNLYMAKLNETSGLVWAVRYGGSANSTAKSLIITRDYDLFHSFHGHGAITFDEKEFVTSAENNQKHPSDYMGSPYRKPARKNKPIDSAKRALTMQVTTNHSEWKKIIFSRYNSFGKLYFAREAAACYRNWCDFDMIHHDEHENIYVFGQFEGVMSFGSVCPANRSAYTYDYLDAKSTRSDLFIMGAGSKTPNGLNTSASSQQDRMPKLSNYLDPCESGMMPIVKVQSRAHRNPKHLCTKSSAEKMSCLKDIYVAMFDRNGTLFWVKNTDTNSIWMRETPLKDFYMQHIKTWQETAREFYLKTFRNIIRPSRAEQVVLGLNDVDAQMQETHKAHALTYYQEMKKYDYAHEMSLPVSTLRKKIQTTVSNIHSFFTDIKRSAYVPCCAAPCLKVACKNGDTDDLLLRLRSGVVDLTNPSVAGKPSIVETGSKVGYMRRLYADWVYDYRYSVFNTVSLRERINTINNLMLSVNNLTSGVLPAGSYHSSSYNQDELRRLLLSPESTFLHGAALYASDTPTPWDVRGRLLTNVTVSDVPSYWTKKSAIQLLHMLRLARSPDPASCCPIERSIGGALTHQQVDATLSVRGPLTELFPSGPSEVDINMGHGWWAITISGTQMKPLTEARRQLMIDSIKTFSIQAIPGKDFVAVIVPLLKANSSQYIVLDVTRNILKFTLPSTSSDPNILSALSTQPSKVEGLVPYSIDYPETVTFSLPASLMEDGSTYNNVAHFVVRPNPGGSALAYQPDPLTTMLPGVTEDAIRFGQKTIEITLSYDKFHPVSNNVEVTKYPFGFQNISDVVADTAFTSDTAIFPAAAAKAMKDHTRLSTVTTSPDMYKIIVKLPVLGGDYTVDASTMETVNVSVNVQATPWLKSKSVTVLGIEHPNIVQFLIRRASVGGTGVIPQRSSEAWVTNWNIAEINEFAIQGNGKYLDFRMQSNTFIPANEFTTNHKVQLIDAMKFKTIWMSGWVKRILPLLQAKADELVQRVDDHTVRVHLPPLSGLGTDSYDIRYPETGVMEIPASLTTQQHSHPFTELIIRPAPGGSLFDNYPVSCSERRMREGCPRNILDQSTMKNVMTWFPCTLQLEVGGFKEGHYEFKPFSTQSAAVIAARIVGIAKSTLLPQAKGFNNAIRPALAHSAHAATGYALLLEKTILSINLPIADGKVHGQTSVPNYLYDITEPEVITLGVPGTLLNTGTTDFTIVAPDQPFGSFVIQPDPTGSLLDCGENGIRSGGCVLNVWLGDDSYLTDGLVEKIQSSIWSGVVPWDRQPAGWMVTVTPVVKAAASAHVLNTAKTLLTITMPSVPTYSIDYGETINLKIPEDMVQSGKKYDGDGEYFTRFMIWAAPSSSSTLLTSEATTNAALVRAGGKTLHFKLDPVGGMMFSSSYACQLKYVAGLTADSASPTGFAAMLAKLTPDGVVLIMDVAMHLLTLTFPAFPTYQIASAEKVSLEVPKACLYGDATHKVKWAPFTINP